MIVSRHISVASSGGWNYLPDDHQEFSESLD